MSRSDGFALKGYGRTLRKMFQGVLVVDKMLEELEGKKVEMGVNIKALFRTMRCEVNNIFGSDAIRLLGRVATR